MFYCWCRALCSQHPSLLSGMVQDVLEKFQPWQITLCVSSVWPLTLKLEVVDYIAMLCVYNIYINICIYMHIYITQSC